MLAKANLEIELDAGHYMIVGSTFDPGSNSTFVLTVLADGPCKLSEVDPKVPSGALLQLSMSFHYMLMRVLASPPAAAEAEGAQAT